jgi:hypothetical protein
MMDETGCHNFIVPPVAGNPSLLPPAYSHLPRQQAPAAEEPTNSTYRQYGNYFFAAGLNGGEQISGPASIPSDFIIVREDKQPLSVPEKEQRLAAIFGSADKELIYQHSMKIQALEKDVRSFIATRFRTLFTEQAQE